MRRLAAGVPAWSARCFSSGAAYRGPSAGRLFTRSLRTATSSANPLPQRLFSRTRSGHHLGQPQRRFASTLPAGVASSGQTRVAVLGVIVAVAGGVTGVVYASEPNDKAQPPSPGELAEDEGLFSPLYKFPLAKKVLNIEENKKALPDPHPPPYGKPITVIIADEILVSQQYQPLSGGTLTKKRPGTEYFLSQLAENYEVVIWSLQPVTSWGPIIEKLDPNHHAAHRLFQDATALGVKDLKTVNRAIEKTIVMDIEPDHVAQVENLILAPKYNGELEDRYLLELLPFFQLLAATAKLPSGVPDVRLWVAGLKKHGHEYFKAKLEEAIRKRKERIEGQRRVREEQERRGAW